MLVEMGYVGDTEYIKGLEVRSIKKKSALIFFNGSAIRLIFLAIFLLPVGLVYAVIPYKTQYSPAVWIGGPWDIPWLDSADEACEVGFAARVAGWPAPWSVVKSIPFIAYDQQGYANECKAERLKDGQDGWGNLDFSLYYRNQVCPANSISVAGGCQCNAGYQEDIFAGVCQPAEVIPEGHTLLLGAMSKRY